MNIDFKEGKVLYNEFHVDFSKGYREQLEALTEDILQIQYDGYLLDVGWYPEYDPEGMFIVQPIKARNWNNPEYRGRCRSEEELMENLEIAINMASKER